MDNHRLHDILEKKNISYDHDPKQMITQVFSTCAMAMNRSSNQKNNQSSDRIYLL